MSASPDQSLDYQLVVKQRFFDLGDELEDPSLNFKSQGRPLTKLFQYLANKVAEHPRLAHIQPRQTPENTAAPLEFKEEGLECDIVFVDNRAALSFWDVDPNELGFHAISAGAYETQDQHYLAEKHRVVVLIDEVYLKQHVFEERMRETDPFSPVHDIEYLMSYLNTLTHELQHCIEFIEAGHGHSPAELDLLFEAGEIEHCLTDFSTGHGILYPVSEDIEADEEIEIMEHRVESNGLDMLRSIDFDYNLVKAVLDEIAPSPESIQAEMDKTSLIMPA